MIFIKLLALTILISILSGIVILKWLIKDLGNKLKHVREEFKLLKIEVGELETLD